ncbi:MAG TPA: PEP/pyruvate-binding domain-containing protein, partial [Acidobacteriota bacterium]|nr:PEP/pyruvate-binding domain-containing protein [Acidobacteriota bacterium]
MGPSDGRQPFIKVPMPAMPRKIIWLSEASRDAAEVGSKAARLGALLASEIVVPWGFCVPLSAYFAHLQASLGGNLVALVRAEKYEEIQHRILDHSIDEELAADVKAALQVARKQGAVSFAVRSSSTAEDLVNHSFAGLYQTRLHLYSDAEIVQSIKRCWSSYWDREAVAYRERAGMNHLEAGMSVLIQQMVKAQIAGVLFTQSPWHGDRLMLLEVVNDYGDALVDGSLAAARFVIDRDSRRLVSGTSSLRDNALLDRLVSLGLRIEETQGGGQDIEWAVDGRGELWILQTRPVTGPCSPPLARELGPDWYLSYEEPFSPLGCDLAVKRYERWVKAINRHNHTSFHARMVEVDGFLYYQPSWRSPALRRRLWTGSWSLYRFLAGTRTFTCYLQSVLPRHLQKMAALNSQNPSELSGNSLWAAFGEAVKAYLDFQETSYPMGALSAISASFLDLACRQLFKKRGMRAVDLLSGLDNISLQRDLALHSLGRMLNRILPPSEIEKLDFAKVRSLSEEADSEWANAFRDFMATYGYVWADRYPRDPAWEINQEALVQSLREAALAPAGEG